MPLRIDINHYHHFVSPPAEVTAHDLNAIATRLRNSNDALEEAMRAVDPHTRGDCRTQRGEVDMSTNTVAQALENVRLEAERNESLDSAASQLFTDLAQIIEDNKTDPAAIQQIADRLRTSNDGLAAAIIARTPAAPGGGGEGGGQSG